MATDIHILLEGIEGESQDATHANEIQVLTFGFGASQSGTAHTGSGSTSGQADVHDLSFTKFVDKSTPLLYYLCCAGQTIESAVLSVRKAGGSAPIDYLQITLNQVLITSFRSGGEGTSDRATETVTLNFSTCKVDYVKQEKDGTAGATVTKGWDVTRNCELQGGA
jgi:type VI secretion system secreted protein Hcp